MQARIKELWLQLCEQAASEQDPRKFLAIVRDISAVLELKTGRLKHSGPQLGPEASALIRCSLCDKPVPLEACKTDEYGRAAHGECYALDIRLKQATTTPKV